MLLALGLVALLVSVVLGIGIGPVYLTPRTVVEALLGQLWPFATHADATSRVIINEVRLPRVAVAAMIGAGMAMSGAILQGVTRNPLADPHIFGISGGASVVAISIIVFLPKLATAAQPVDFGVPFTGLDFYMRFGALQPLSFLGGMTAGAMAYAMAWRGGVSPTRLALAGIAVTAILTSLSSAVLVSSSYAAQIGLRWMIGGLGGSDRFDMQVLFPYFLVGTVLAFAMSRQVNVIALGDDLARGLGQHVERTRLALVAIAALLASASVSIGGLIGFLGLIVPHVLRLVIGNDYRFLLPASALFGACLLVVADTAARTVFDPVEMPVGVFTAVLGGPVFIMLVRRRA